MATRLKRAEQVQRNRELVLAAARRVFVERGYHAASVDEIAEDAGFSKGVVYSQFASKADLFLALLDQRIDERAAQNEAITAGRTGADAVAAIVRNGVELAQAERRWGLLVTEFRVHAARDAELNARYLAAHERTLAAVAARLEGVYAAAGETPPRPPRVMAELLLAFATGGDLELAANPKALGGRGVAELLTQILTTRPEEDR
jgi:AcrR family transcriptional regulator